MNLFFFMLVSAFLGLLLLAAGPTFGSFFAFMILAGCLFRGLYLLNKINDQLTKISDKDKKSSVSTVNKTFAKQMEQ